MYTILDRHADRFSVRGIKHAFKLLTKLKLKAFLFNSIQFMGANFDHNFNRCAIYNRFIVFVCDFFFVPNISVFFFYFRMSALG